MRKYRETIFTKIFNIGIFGMGLFLYVKFAISLTSSPRFILITVWLFFIFILEISVKSVLLCMTRKIIINEKGIAESFGNHDVEFFNWKDFLKKKIKKSNDKISAIDLYFKDKRKPLVLSTTLENFNELADLVMNYIEINCDVG